MCKMKMSGGTKNGVSWLFSRIVPTDRAGCNFRLYISHFGKGKSQYSGETIRDCLVKFSYYDSAAFTLAGFDENDLYLKNDK